MLRGLPDTYTIIRKLGEGGGGVVYLGYHRNLKKYVVLKKQKYVARKLCILPQDRRWKSILSADTNQL